MEKWILSIKNYLEKCIDILRKLSKVQIPEEYIVYEKHGQRYIVIKDLDEVKLTKEICKKYKLEYLVRR